jgi:predicted N-acetyltransferase YhbS
MRIELIDLPDDVETIETVALWLHHEWGRERGVSVDHYASKLRESLGAKPIPYSLAAFDSGAPVGVASLQIHDMQTRKGLSPWLANVYVIPEYRNRGIGGRLCRGVTAKAGRLGISRLYLFTPDRESFYSAMGWKLLERAVYRGQNVAVMELRLSKKKQSLLGNRQDANG